MTTSNYPNENVRMLRCGDFVPEGKIYRMSMLVVVQFLFSGVIRASLFTTGFQDLLSGPL